MRILVTGGAGYIGSLLCPMLLEQGHEVLLYDNFMWGVRSILHLFSNPKFQITAGDVRDKAALNKAMSAADVVIHLAAIVGYPACTRDPDLAHTTNVEGTRHVCSLISPNQRLIFASTGSTYGQVDGVADETTAISPLTIYGKTKRDGEAMALDVGAVSLRYATVFGISPRLRLDLLINDFCYQAYHQKYIVVFEGHHRRTFMHVTDAVRVLLFVLEHLEKMKGDVFNVGHPGLNYTKIEAARRIQNYVDFYLHEADVGEDPDKRNYEVSYQRIQSLGFQAQFSLDQGIEEVLKVVPFIKLNTEWKNA